MISTGGMLLTAVQAAELLAKEGIAAGVLSMHTLKPLDAEAVLAAARRSPLLVTLEEHSILGGLGGAVAEVLCEAGPPRRPFPPLRPPLDLRQDRGRPGLFVRPLRPGCRVGQQSRATTTGVNMLAFEPFDGSLDDWGAVLDTLPGREVFQTPAWLRFVSECHQGSPVVAVLKDRDRTVGYFAGLVVKKAGIRVLGSPFVGWTTERMGIRLVEDVPKGQVLAALERYAFEGLACAPGILRSGVHAREHGGPGLRPRAHYGWIVDLRPDEDALYHSFSSKSCRYCIRKAEKMGVVVEEARDEAFAEDYYAQLVEVFANQSLVPTYGSERVRLLMKHLLPTGNLLLLRARDREGRCIATGIFPGMHQAAYFWGNASWRQYRHLSPNEAIHWYAMRYWKRRGIESLRSLRRRRLQAEVRRPGTQFLLLPQIEERLVPTCPGRGLPQLQAAPAVARVAAPAARGGRPTPRDRKRPRRTRKTVKK